MTHRLGHDFDPIERPDRGEHMGRVRPLPTTGLQPPTLPAARQQGVEQESLGRAGRQTGAKLAQHRRVEARIGQVQPEGVLPVDPAAYRVSGLAIRERLGKLQDADQRQPPRRFCGPAPSWEQVRKGPILIDRAQLIAHAHGGCAVWEGSAGHPHRLLRDRTDGLRSQGHGVRLRAFLPLAQRHGTPLCPVRPAPRTRLLEFASSIEIEQEPGSRV